MAETSAQPLIVGAGPVGLAAALFLARDGVLVRIIDSAAGPSANSKALAVNPRTLEILEPTGITEQMLSIGKPIRGGRFSRGQHVLGEFNLQGLHHKYRFMLALSQATTARLIEAALSRLGVRVEWGLGLLHCRQGADAVEADLCPANGGPPHTVRCPWMLAADGAHSTVRHKLGIPFEGTSFHNEWHLADLPLKTSLAEDLAHVYFLDEGGFLFLIRVVDERDKEPGADRIWRVIGNVPDLVGRLVDAKPAGPVVWASSFHISHRINATLEQGRVYFAGDAAHVHSPIGARGMNLGIEDAWVFSRLLKTGRLSEYDRLRRPVDRRVVRQVELLSRLVQGESRLSRLLRSTALPLLMRTSLFRRRMIQTVTGLDHPLPGGQARESVSDPPP